MPLASDFVGDHFDKYHLLVKYGGNGFVLVIVLLESRDRLERQQYVRSTGGRRSREKSTHQTA